MRTTLRVLTGLAAVCLLGVSTSGAPDAMRVHVIDVGQGSATLIEFPCAAILIDTGGERMPADPALPAQFISTVPLMAYLKKFFSGRPDLKNQLAQLVLSHPHLDHTRGVADVINQFKPRSLVHNGQSTGSGIEGQTLARTYAKEEGIPRWYVLEKTINKKTGLTNDAIDPVNCTPTNPQIRALWGQADNDATWDPDDFDDENNHSVVLRIDYGEASILFSGDLEETTKPGTGKLAGIERLIQAYQGTGLLDVDVWHVSHHGSHNGTTLGLLSAMSPQIALMSVGPACDRPDFSAWNFGHPRKVTVDDLESAITGTRTPRTVRVFSAADVTPAQRTEAKAIYATGWDGNIVLEGRADGTWSTISTSGPAACLKGK